MLALLAACVVPAAPPSQKSDWLVHRPVERTALVSDGAGVLRLTNGLIERVFLARGGAFCTIDLRHLVSSSSFFRALSAEARMTLSEAPDGAPHHFDIGGCAGQPDGHYEFFDADALLPTLHANASAFQYRNHSTAAPLELFPWKPGVRGAPTNIPWPPLGLHLAVEFIPPVEAPEELRGVVATVHYEMYDGLPTYRKWVSVTNAAGVVVLQTLHYELMRAPNWAPEHMTIMRQQANNPTPFDQQVRPDHAHVASLGRNLAHWNADPQYDQCCDRELHVPYTTYTLLAVGYDDSQIYGGPTGPGALLHAGAARFDSLSVRVTLHDSSDVDRQGLGVRQMLRTLAPSLNEAPLLGMLTDASSSYALRLFVNQMASTGHELAIIGFGAKGWCGMCEAQLTNATFRDWMRAEVAYARGRGVTLSAYTLMQHNGWGEKTPTDEQTLNRDGTRGPTACFATDFHARYRQHVLDFVSDVGLGGLETDGQFEGIACADATHDHSHNGLAGGWSAQMEVTLGFNVELKKLGIYQTGADGYAFSGAQRWNHADTDQFQHLPLWEQITVGRMYTYDSTMTRVPSSGQIGVQDLVPALASPDSGCERAGGRLRCLDFVLGSLYIFAGQPNFRAPRLFDPADPDRSAIVSILSKWTAFFRAQRAPRPSGDPGLLFAKMVHVARPSARDIEACVHMTSDGSTSARALIALVNPTRRTLNRTITIPLHYSGLAPGTRVSIAPLNLSASVTDAGAAAHASAIPSAAASQPFASGKRIEMHKLGADAAGGLTDVVLDVHLEPASYAVLLCSL